MKKVHVLSFLALAVSTACHADGQTYPDPVFYSQSDFGGTGLMQLPTARIAPEGEFSLSYRNNDQYRFYTTSIALFPWLEGTIRYTDVRTERYSQNTAFSGSQSYKDKSFDFKVRLLKESYYLPELAFGKRDISGTGLFDGEFFVGSKRAGPLDFTLGMGWGYIGNSGNVTNPLCRVSDKYCHRSELHDAGDISFDGMFKGPASIIGGVEYQSPWYPLRLKLEYDGNDYKGDKSKNIQQFTHFNFGAVYRVTDWADVNLSYERGNTLMFGFTLRANLNDLRPVNKDNPKPAYHPEITENAPSYTAVANQLTQLKYNAGFDDPEIKYHDKTLYMSGQQQRYRDPREAVDRANRILVNNLPADVDTINVTQTKMHLPLVTTETNVASLKKELAGYPLGHEDKLEQKRIEPNDPVPDERGYRIKASRFNYAFEPKLIQSLGGPEDFYMYQIGVIPSASYWVTNHWLVDSGVFININNNYNKFNSSLLPSDSNLPRVRTHIRDYVRNNVYISNLQTNYITDLGHGFYGQAYGGYLEMMYGGVGAELLYRPLDSQWAIGIDGNYVKQRDWNDMMRFNDYSVKTGFITTYWTPSELNGVVLKVAVGQYLAGDKGVTVEMAKRFDSGVQVGIWGAKSNVSKQDYGEGGFSKGFYISIPFDLMSVTPDQNHAVISWTPLTRDGGQSLNRKYRLYDMTSERELPLGQ